VSSGIWRTRSPCATTPSRTSGLKPRTHSARIQLVLKLSSNDSSVHGDRVFFKVKNFDSLQTKNFFIQQICKFSGRRPQFDSNASFAFLFESKSETRSRNRQATERRHQAVGNCEERESLFRIREKNHRLLFCQSAFLTKIGVERILGPGMNGRSRARQKTLSFSADFRTFPKRRRGLPVRKVTRKSLSYESSQ
jgi:hypothetical protein